MPELSDLLRPKPKPPIQCWHCGKFRRVKDVFISRNWEDWNDWTDVICSTCREKEHVTHKVIALVGATGYVAEYVRDHIRRLQKVYKTPEAIADRIRLEITGGTSW